MYILAERREFCSFNVQCLQISRGASDAVARRKKGGDREGLRWLPLQIS